MNPIPISWLAIGGITLAAAGFSAGWAVQDWRRDSQDLKELQRATEKLKKQTDRVATSATKYEQDRVVNTRETEERTHEIRTIYKDRPVAADCALPDATQRVLNAGIASANARASGEPRAELPTDLAPDPTTRPRAGGVGE